MKLSPPILDHVILSQEAPRIHLYPQDKLGFYSYSIVSALSFMTPR